ITNELNESEDYLIYKEENNNILKELFIVLIDNLKEGQENS
ncbi:5815_t:CDS:1, partial [Dentiscutata heterogama]